MNLEESAAAQEACGDAEFGDCAWISRQREGPTQASRRQMEHNYGRRRNFGRGFMTARRSAGARGGVEVGGAAEVRCGHLAGEWSVDADGGGDSGWEARWAAWARACDAQHERGGAGRSVHPVALQGAFFNPNTMSLNSLKIFFSHLNNLNFFP